MAKRLDPSDRDILGFRPNIEFVEPEDEPGTIDAVEGPTPFEDIQAARERIKKFANAVNTMAAAIQARADERAKDFVVKLDRDADQDAIQAMRRHFPDVDPNQIPYSIYRQARDCIREQGVEIGRRGIITPEEVRSARDDLDQNNFIPGGFGSDAANTGGLRPELDAKARIIDPINYEDFQINMICIFANFIWKNLLLKAFGKAKIPVAKVSIASLLPKKLCNPGAPINIPGSFTLGQKQPDELTGKAAEDAQASVDEEIQ